MTDHIPLPPPDHTEDVPGFVHDTQRHYYSGETLRAHAERLHATRANGPAIMQAIGLLAVLQSWIGPRRPEGSEPEGRALWDQIEATRTALTPLAPAAVAEPLVRYCPGCGSVGHVDSKYRDCCPDGNEARMIPQALAQKCHDTFRLAVEGATAAPAAQGDAQDPLEGAVLWPQDALAARSQDKEGGDAA